jgi:glutaredoxin
MRDKLKVALPALLLVYIALETILKSYNIELCSSTGCEMAGSLLKFNSTYLNYLGMLGAFALIVLAFFKGKNAHTLYTTVAVAMVIFESILIASQLNLNPELCKFCLGVYSFLLLILLNANWKLFLGLVPAIVSVFVAFSFLAIPKNKTLISQNGLYLIASPTCPHCKKTKKYLKEHAIEFRTIPASDINAFYFAKTLGISQIPIAIQKEGTSYKVLVGDKKIIEHFEAKNSNLEKEQKTPIQESVSEVNGLSKLNIYGDEQEGCSLSLTATASDCEANDGGENGK